MSVTQLHSAAAPDPGLVALLVRYGITDDRCGEATWAELEAARTIIEAVAVITRLKAAAGDILSDRMLAAGAETLGEYAASLDGEERVRVASLVLMMETAVPGGDA